MDRFNFILRYAASCFLLVGIFSCSSKRIENQEIKKSPVKIQLVSYSDNLYRLEYVGTIEGENTVDLSFQVNGNLEQTYVGEGQRVQKGQLLARLNTNSIKNMYDVAKATLSQAQDAFDRLSLLHESKSLPEIKYIEAKTALEQAKSSERIARKNLEDCNLYAPFSGVIGRRYQESGANVMPGAPIYNLVNVAAIKVKIAIPENEISLVSVGDPCQVKISAIGDQSFEAKVTEKGIAAHPISHTYDIKARIVNPSSNIMPGMVCKTYLNRSSKSGKGNIIIPVKAVQIDFSGKRFVWVKGIHDKAEYREVAIGELACNGVVIEGGLNEGDSLIVEGYQNLSPGSLVAVVK